MMGLKNWAYKKMARVGVRGLVKQQASQQLNSSWEQVFGELMGRQSANNLWGVMPTNQKERVIANHALIYACVHLICRAWSEAHVQIGNFDEDGEFDGTMQDPIVHLLNNPNPALTTAEFYSYDLSHMLLTGRSFIWKWRNSVTNAAGRKTEVTELWPIPSSWVKPIKLDKPIQGTQKRFISHYEVKVPNTNTNGTQVPVEDMIFRRFVDPNSFTGAIGPFQAAFRDYRLDTEKDNYMIEMLENLKVPGLVIKQTMEFAPEEKDELRQILIETVGKGKRGNPLFLHGEGAELQMIAPLKDLDWPGLSSMNESRLCSAFGVPPLLVHARVAQENSPLSAPNLKAAEELFFRTTMTGLWKACAQNLTAGLIVQEGDQSGRILHYDLTKVRALQGDMEKIAKVCKLAVDGTMMQINEGRRKLGLKPDPAMEGKYKMKMNEEIVTAEEINESNEIPEPDNNPDEDQDDDKDNQNSDETEGE